MPVAFLRGLSTGLFLLLCASPVLANEPGEADFAQAKTSVQALYDELLATMKEGEALGLDGRRERLAPAVAEAYDVVEAEPTETHTDFDEPDVPS